MPVPTRLDVELPDGRRELIVDSTDSISVLLRRAGLPLNTRCGERGLCDGCHIELREGRLVHANSGRMDTAIEQSGVIRACEYRVSEGTEASFRVPARSLLGHELQVITDFSVNVSIAHWPLGAGLGIAIDVGTTTVALLLVDLTDGRILARAAGANRQIALGDNVLTRINLCMTNTRMVSRLQDAIVDETIRPLLARALLEADAEEDDIACMAVVGNTTMLHLLAGVDPTPMGVAPFSPSFVEHRSLHAEDLDLRPHARSAAGRPVVHLLPGAAAYVGADISAGIIATGLLYDDGPSLLVDVGTNGEIVLKHGDRLYGAATAAGPAFEGVGLTCGMRAGNGAIAHVRYAHDPLDLRTDVIGSGEPRGLCGSAYIDVLAHARRVGLLGPMGRLASNNGDASTARFVASSHAGRALRIADGDNDRDIVVTEADIARLLPAKAAIAAGILTLLERAGLRADDVETVYLAGGFGMHLDPTSAVSCGLLPGLSPSRIQPVGNSALAGAYLALLDAGILEELIRISPRIEILELNLDPDFEGRYIEQLTLPA